MRLSTVPGPKAGLPNWREQTMASKIAATDRRAEGNANRCATPALRQTSGGHDKPLAIILAVLGWVGVGIVSSFHKIVPHASLRKA